MKRSDLLVVRHSERVDEANIKLWNGVIDYHYALFEPKKKNSTSLSSFPPSSSQPSAAAVSARHELLIVLKSWFRYTPIDLIEPIKRDIRCFASDPILFDSRGLKIAEKAAITVHDLVSSVIPHPQPGQIRIFCSKLRRCVQTAIPLARRFNLPIVLSTGLAQFIVLVRRQKGHFQFVPIIEWQMLYPDIHFIDGDLDLQESLGMPAIPVDDWWRCLDVITANPSLTADSPRRVDIIVSHRETIKELAGFNYALPYCAIAHFDSSTFRPRSLQAVQAQVEEEKEDEEEAKEEAKEEEAKEGEAKEGTEAAAARKAEDPEPEPVPVARVAQSPPAVVSSGSKFPLIKTLSNMFTGSSSSDQAQPSAPTSKAKVTAGNNDKDKTKLKRTKKKKRQPPVYEEICQLRNMWDFGGYQIYPPLPDTTAAAGGSSSRATKKKSG